MVSLILLWGFPHGFRTPFIYLLNFIFIMDNDVYQDTFLRNLNWSLENVKWQTQPTFC